ncbi:MAG: DNA/RNA non-specific endonuclease [Bacteroidota bacterium]
MNRRYTYIILVILVTTVLYFAERYVNKRTEHYPSDQKEAKADTSEFNEQFYPSSTTHAIVSHNYFTLSYSEVHEQAEWVAYELLPEHISSNQIERPYFVQDRKVRSESADWRNYKNSGFDRGHLCPAGDRKFDYNAFHETFLTSNISPQDPDFNGGIWNRLEQKVRFWAKKYDGVFVVTGGVLKSGLSTIGNERVSVPDHFYKIVADHSEENIKAIAFLIPNDPSERSFYDFAVTIDQIEKETGIDFFAGLPDSEEKKLEETVDLKAWGGR